MRYELTLRSTLHAPPEPVWDWITSVKGISAELRPLLRMSMPRGMNRLDDVRIVPGERLFRSWIYLFGFLPFDYSDLTLVEMSPGAGFVEESSMLSMRVWRHERRIRAEGDGCVIEDRLAFEPRFAAAISRWFVTWLFRHRHAVLRQRFGAA